MGEIRIDSSFHESSDKACKSLKFDTVKPQTSHINSVKDHLSWLLKLILEEPALDLASDTGYVTDMESSSVALEPYFGQSKCI